MKAIAMKIMVIIVTMMVMIRMVLLVKSALQVKPQGRRSRRITLFNRLENTQWFLFIIILFFIAAIVIMNMERIKNKIENRVQICLEKWLVVDDLIAKNLAPDRMCDLGL